MSYLKKALFFLITFQPYSQISSHTSKLLTMVPPPVQFLPSWEVPIPTTSSLSTHSSHVLLSLLCATVIPMVHNYNPSSANTLNHVSSPSLPRGKSPNLVKQLSAFSVPVPTQLNAAGKRSHNQADRLDYKFMITKLKWALDSAKQFHQSCPCKLPTLQNDCTLTFSSNLFQSLPTIQLSVVALSKYFILKKKHSGAPDWLKQWSA